jgi:NhaP-type Na+/H+ or K+/H+ antiporter
VPLNVFDALAFGSLLSATDPVAVLAVFDQVWEMVILLCTVILRINGGRIATII